MAIQAYTQTDDFLELWNMSSQENERLMKKWLSGQLDIYRQHKSTLFSKFKKGQAVTNPVPRWVEMDTYPMLITGTLSGSGTTLTVTGNLFSASITRANLLKVVNATNTILRYETGGTVSLAKVTAIHSTNPVLTVEAYGNTTMPADGASQQWRVIAEPYKDSRDADTARVLSRKTRWCSTQILSRTFEILDTRQATAVEIIANEAETQVKELIESMHNEMANSLIQGWPAYSGGAYVGALNVEDPTVNGLDWWAHYLFGSGGEAENSGILRDIAGDALDMDDISDTMEEMENCGTDFNEGNWLIAVHPKTAKYMNDYGLSYRQQAQDSRVAGFLVDYVDTKIGKRLEIVRDRYVPKDTAYIVDADAATWGYFSQDEIHRKELPSGGRYKRWQISCQIYGIMLRNAKIKLGKIKNLKTS